jgi:ubiquinone/menaquinone biosynthesis C-methylase UbiE
VEGDAEAMPFPEASFDAVVCTLAMCGVPDMAAVLAEMRRVLVPGGRLLLLDHVASTNLVLRGLQRVVEAFTGRLSGEYYTRRPALLLASTGFAVVEEARSAAGMVERVHAVKAG